MKNLFLYFIPWKRKSIHQNTKPCYIFVECPGLLESLILIPCTTGLNELSFILQLSESLIKPHIWEWQLNISVRILALQ